MKYLEIPMHLPGYREGDYEPKLYAYLLDPIKDYRPAPRPAVLICPGGAYAYTSDREAEPLALYFLAAGIPTFVLRYSVAEVSDAKFPTSLREVSLAMAYIRAHGGEWAIDPQRVFVCGSSAGGHLAASLGVHWDKELVWKGAGIPFGENRPAGTILMYPVISSGEKQHVGSFHNLMGETETPELREFLSLEKQVSGNTPPAFLWHTFEDPSVPVENSLLYAAALAKHHIPFELHVYPRGGHGLALANELTSLGDPALVVPECQEWVANAIRWVKSFEATGESAGK